METGKQPIAVVGLGGVFPGAADLGEFWQLIADRFQAAGYSLTFEELILEKSQVTVVIARKPSEELA